MQETGRQAPPVAARLAVAAIFFVNGAGFANWVVRIPTVRERLGLGEATLGVALLGVAVGAMIAMPIGGGLVVRYGSRPVVRLAALPFCASLALPPLAPSLPLLALSLVLVGACSGVLDVSMNAQAAAVERRYGRPIMASFHGLFSLGGLAGAAVGGFVAAQGVDPKRHLFVVALVLGVGAAFASNRLLAASADASGSGPSFALPPRSLLATGAVAFCVLFGEGAMADWSAVYLRTSLGTDPGTAAAGFAAFSLMMAAGRLAGDGLAARLGVVSLVRLGGLCAALGPLKSAGGLASATK